MSNTARHSRFDTLADDVEYRVHQRFEWSHIVVLGVGNLLFLIGSWLFFYAAWETAAIWLFVIGSGFHLSGTILRVLNKQYVHRLKKQAIHW